MERIGSIVSLELHFYTKEPKWSELDQLLVLNTGKNY